MGQSTVLQEYLYISHKIILTIDYFTGIIIVRLMGQVYSPWRYYYNDQMMNTTTNSMGGNSPSDTTC